MSSFPCVSPNSEEVLPKLALSLPWTSQPPSHPNYVQSSPLLQAPACGALTRIPGDLEKGGGKREETLWVLVYVNIPSPFIHIPNTTTDEIVVII